jgi:hypothetical protein
VKNPDYTHKGKRGAVGLAFVPSQAILVCLMSLLRVILWPSTMAYTGFLLTGQGLRTFNSLSITEACLGALTGLLLAIMFTLREKRHQRPAFVAHSIIQFLPHLGALVPKRKRNDG